MEILTVIKTLWGIFKEYAPLGADLCILIITLYTTWKTFFEKRIKLINYSSVSRMFEGDYITLTVENTSLSPISVLQVNIIYDDKYKLQIKKYNTPLIIESMHAENIEMEPYTSLSKFDSFDLDVMNYVVEFITTKGIIYSTYKKQVLTNYKKQKLEQITAHRKFINGKVMPHDTKYVLLVKEGNESKTIFINDGGIMSDDIYGINAVSRDLVNVESVVQEEIKSIFDKYNPNAIYKLMSV